MSLEELFHDKIKSLAYKFYIERKQNAGSELEDWLKAKTLVYRTVAGIIYLFIGAVGFYYLFPLIQYFISIYIIEVLWCVSWSMIGVGIGLINTRNNPQINALHLIGYWLFVSLVVSMTSFAISLYISGENLSNLFIKFYSISALLSLLGGFLGDIFRDLALKIINKK